MRFGIMTGMNGARWQDMLDVWKFVDEVGYSTGWIPDHFYSGSANVFGECYEGWSTVAAMALATRRLRVGTMVSGNTYRHPAVLANMVATIDHISNGRVELGMGGGWMKVEHDGYGIPLPSPKERLDRLDEALTVMKLLLTERKSNFAGHYYQLADAICEPKPIQKPYPHLLVGGGGEKRTMRVAAKHVDEWNGEVGPSGMKRKIGILRQHCLDIGRDPDEIEVSVLIRIEAAFESTYQGMVLNNNTNLLMEHQLLREQGVPESEIADRAREVVYSQFLPDDEGLAAERLHEYAEVGVSHIVVSRPYPYDYRAIERLVTHIAPRAGVV
jgi:F420-dependent oxidoreductase-like protein